MPNRSPPTTRRRGASGIGGSKSRFTPMKRPGSERRSSGGRTPDAPAPRPADLARAPDRHRAALGTLDVVRWPVHLDTLAGARLHLLANDPALVYGGIALVRRRVVAVDNRRAGDRADHRRLTRA